MHQLLKRQASDLAVVGKGEGGGGGEAFIRIEQRTKTVKYAEIRTPLIFCGLLLLRFGRKCKRKRRRVDEGRQKLDNQLSAS
jgi:hypothetical protein